MILTAKEEKVQPGLGTLCLQGSVQPHARALSTAHALAAWPQLSLTTGSERVPLRSATVWVPAVGPAALGSDQRSADAMSLPPQRTL